MFFCKEVIYMKNAIVNVAFAAFITANAVVVAAISYEVVREVFGLIP